MSTPKLVLNSTDLVNIMGVSDRTARRKLREIKAYFGKERHHQVTIDEFCHHTGIPHESIYSYFGWTWKKE